MPPPTCPECQTPVPPEVVNGPPITAYRCSGCAMTITWREGRAIASKSRILPQLPQPPAAKPAVADSSARTELVPSPLAPRPAAAPAAAPAPVPLGGPAATDVTAPLPAQPAPATSTGPAPVALGESEVPVSSGAALGFPRGEEAPKPLAPPSKKRAPLPRPALVALGLLVLAGLGWAVFGRGSKPQPEDAPSVSLRDDAPAPPEPDAVAPAPEPPPPEKAPEPAPKPAPVVAKTPEPGPKPAEPPVKAPGPGPSAAPKPAAPAGPKLGGKQVVLEYDKGPEGGAALPPEIAADVQRARTLYQQGNAKLFGGDAKAAVSLYEQSLKAYPGYVGAYRGLGLAWSERKESARALAAFRTYAKNAPGAKDAALIKKVIAKLEAEVAASKK